jgi:hypothetical protein
MRRAIVLFVLTVIATSTAWAYGGGGAFWGRTLPFGRWTNTDLTFDYSGGYGYGVTDGGHRIGGFGVGVTAEDGTAVGGFGGIMNGQQVRLGALTASLNTWLGVGGLSLPSGAPLEFFGYFAELSGELGLAVLPWLQVSAYLGMQAMGNLIPGDPIVDNSIYSPVSGIRLTWGSF